MSSYGPPLSFSDLASKLIQHGLRCSNSAEYATIEKRIRSVGYYRLEEYSWPYRKTDAAKPFARLPEFKAGVTIELIWNTYVFDRRLRILLLDAIERFEVALKANITQVLVDKAGHNAPQTDLRLLPKFAATDKLGVSRLDKWLKKANDAYKECKGARIEHCREIHKTQDVRDLPLWILMEILTFGSVRKLYEAMDLPLQHAVASQMGVEPNILDSSVELLHHVRNCCAHHGRVWNRKWSKPCRNNLTMHPLFSAKPVSPEWYCHQQNGAWTESSSCNGKVFSFRPSDTAFAIVLCGYWLTRIAHTSTWKERVEQTVQPHGKLLKNAQAAGFMKGWHHHPLWSI